MTVSGSGGVPFSEDKPPSRLSFTDLFDLEEIQALQDAFSSATGVGSVITDSDGVPITRESNFCRLCNDLIRKTDRGLANCMRSDATIGRFNPSGPTVQPCLSGGLWDAGASISAGGVHVANWLVGQVRNDEQDEEQMLEYAEEIGADPDEFRAALAEVPTMSREQFENVAQALFLLASQLSSKAYQNAEQARIIAERAAVETALRESEEKYRNLTETMQDVVWTMDAETMSFIYVSPSVKRQRGFTAEEIIALPVDAALTPEEVDGLKAVIMQRAADFSEGLVGPDHYHTDLVEQPCKDGSTLWTEVVSAYYRSPSTGRVEVRGVTRDISARKKAEDELRESERWLNESQRVAGLGHYVYEIGADHWEGSPALYDVFGTVDTRGGDLTAWLGIIHPDDRQMAASHFADDVLGGRQPFDLEYRIVRATDGCERWVHGLGTVEYRADGSPVAMFGVVQDITERKQAQIERTENEDRLQALLDNAPYGAHMYELRDDGRLVFVGFNERAGQILGVDHTPLIGKTLEEAFPGNVGTDTPDAYRRIARDGGTWETEQYAYDAEGIAGVFEVFAFSFGPNRVSVFFRDITEKRKLEVAVADSESKLNKAQEFAKIGSWSWHVKTDQLEWSDEMFRLFGIDKETFTGSLSEVVASAIHPDDRAAVEESNASVANDSQPVPLEYRVVWPDGSVHWVWAEAGELETDEHGSPLMLSGTVQDITDRKMVEQELLRRTAELERSNHELESFAYVASHDLQEPLRMVAGYTQLLQRRYEGRLDSDADEFIGYAVDGAVRMQQLLEDLLDYSRVGTRGKEPVPVESRVAFDDAIENLAAPISETGARLDVGELPVVMADKSQLMRVFQNLIGNAIKFRKPDEAPHVVVSTERDGRMWRFCLADNGIGIDPEGFERVFDVFQRLNTRAEYPGTGIGLSICKRIVERLGGSIWIEASSGSGTTFCFTLPAPSAEE